MKHDKHNKNIYEAMLGKSNVPQKQWGQAYESCHTQQSLLHANNYFTQKWEKKSNTALLILPIFQCLAVLQYLCKNG